MARFRKPTTRALYEPLAVFLEDYLVILSTTFHIVRAPYGFGNQIRSDRTELKRSVIYLTQTYIFLFAILEIGDIHFPLAILSGKPFSDELTALLMVVLVLTLALGTHTGLRLLTSRKTHLYGIVAGT